MIRPEWASLIIKDAYCEILVFDRSSLQLLFLNESAAANLQIDASRQHAHTLHSIIRESAAFQAVAALDALNSARKVVTLHTFLSRADGTAYPAELRLRTCDDETTPVVIVIANDVSDRHDSAQALQSSESRFRGIVSSTPGLFFQMAQTTDGSMTFPYLSEGCHALLGIDAKSLQSSPPLFIASILADDRESFQRTMAESATSMSAWNWEGRLHIEEWNDIKWINLRATPRLTEDGSIQWDGIMANITQSKVVQAEVERSRSDLAELSAHVDQVKEEERKRIARELHDDLGGNLTAIKMALALLVRRFPEDGAALLDKAAYLDQLVDRTIDAVHRIAGNLRPSVLDIGIVDAIQWQAQEFERQIGLTCKVDSNVTDINLSPDQSTALFRIFQEALTNVGKHAGASRVDVRLLASDDEIRLEIADDGQGIAPRSQAKPGSYGILGMTERTNALGGTLALYNAPAGGCIVTISIPLHQPPKLHLV